MPKKPKVNESIQVTHIVPPVFPDGVATRLVGGMSHLIFFAVPNPAEQYRLNAIADVVCNPSFLLTIAEKCLGAVRIFDPSVELDPDRVEKHRAALSASMISPRQDEGAK
jgi:hypothetical protein